MLRAGTGVAAIGCVLDIHATWHVIRDVALDNAVCFVATGAIAAVFLGGAVVGWLLLPFSAALGQQGEALAPLENAGRYIGWCERAVFFVFITAGQPDAAAVALAAKSFARFPALNQHQEGFAEYFLVGTLASIAVATAAAVGTRAALGLPAL